MNPQTACANPTTRARQFVARSIGWEAVLVSRAVEYRQISNGPTPLFPLPDADIQVGAAYFWRIACPRFLVELRSLDRRGARCRF